ncbi:CbrC family protein [Streptomyces sp. NPDC003362]
MRCEDQASPHGHVASCLPRRHTPTSQRVDRRTYASAGRRAASLGGTSGSRALAEGRRGPGAGRSTNWAWQDPHWLVHCQDAAAFVGEVGYSELAAHPEALDQLRADLCLDGRHGEGQLEKFLADLGAGATAMLFRCTVCGAHLAYADAS